MGRPRRRWEDNIRMDLEEIGINAGNWVGSAHYMELVNNFVFTLINKVVTSLHRIWYPKV